jgi:hypothetical protein
MVEVLERARRRMFPGVRLMQPAYHQRSLSLYTKLEFDAREPLPTMQGGRCGYQSLDTPSARRARATPTRATRSADAYTATTGDRARQRDRSRARRRHDWLRDADRLFGHAVGETNDDLKALISAADGFAGPDVDELGTLQRPGRSVFAVDSILSRERTGGLNERHRRRGRQRAQPRPPPHPYRSAFLRALGPFPKLAVLVYGLAVTKILELEDLANLDFGAAVERRALEPIDGFRF